MKAPPLPRKSKKLKAKRALRCIRDTLQLEPLKNRWKLHKVHKYNRHNKWSILRSHSRSIAQDPKCGKFFWSKGRRGNRSKRAKNLPLMIVHMRVAPKPYQNKVAPNNTDLVYLEKKTLFKLHLSNHQYKLKPLLLDSPTQKLLDLPSFTPAKIQKKELYLKKQFNNLLDVKLNYYGPNVLKTVCIPILKASSPILSSVILAQSTESRKNLTFGAGKSVQVSKTNYNLENPLPSNAYHRKKLRQKYLSTKKSIQGFLQQMNEEMEEALTGNLEGIWGNLTKLTLEAATTDTSPKKLGVLDFYKRSEDIITGYSELVETLKRQKKT